MPTKHAQTRADCCVAHRRRQKSRARCTPGLRALREACVCSCIPQATQESIHDSGAPPSHFGALARARRPQATVCLATSQGLPASGRSLRVIARGGESAKTHLRTGRRRRRDEWSNAPHLGEASLPSPPTPGTERRRAVSWHVTAPSFPNAAALSCRACEESFLRESSLEFQRGGWSGAKRNQTTGSLPVR